MHLREREREKKSRGELPSLRSLRSLLSYLLLSYSLTLLRSTSLHLQARQGKKEGGGREGGRAGGAGGGGERQIEKGRVVCVSVCEMCE